MDELAEWFELTQEAARTAILTRKAIQLTCLGVADVYQGSESLQNSLVDPDNRGRVDFEKLVTQCSYLDRRQPVTLAERSCTSPVRSYVRRRRPGAFVGGGGIPPASGVNRTRACARGDDPQVVTVAARLHRVLASTSGFTEHTVVLPRGTWTDILTGHQYAGGAASCLQTCSPAFPCAVLERTSDATELLPTRRPKTTTTAACSAGCSALVHQGLR